MIESLETRRMFAATAALVAGNLQITGTPANDVIAVNQAALPSGVNVTRVSLNGVNRSFPAAAVKTITARLLAGNDRFVANISGPNGPLDNGKVMLTVFGSTGNDFISGTNLNDRLFGEAGNDVLRGNEGFDRLDGGANDDRLFGGYENDVLIGGLGRDFLDGEDGNDRIFASGDGASDRIVNDDDYTDVYVTDSFDVFVI